MIFILIVCFIVLITIIELTEPMKNYFNLCITNKNTDELKLVENEIVNVNKDENKDENENENENENKKENLKEYTLYKDTNIKYPPGKIMINSDSNVFINYKDKVFFVKKDVVYNIKSDFEIQVIFTNEEKISYFYIES